MAYTGTGFNKVHSIIWSKNYNLMGENSNNISGWPENLKSRQIVRGTPAPDVIFCISPSVFFTIQLTVSASISNRRTNRAVFAVVACSVIFKMSFEILILWQLSPQGWRHIFCVMILPSTAMQILGLDLPWEKFLPPKQKTPSCTEGRYQLCLLLFSSEFSYWQ